ncbi:MAG: nucleotidyltransferase family protein, partial [bacterium]
MNRSLENWLLDNGPLPNAAALRAAKLGAYAYTALPADHPDRAQFRTEYVAAFGRHEHLKSELRPLLREWRAHGVDVLLFKGFQLSEFVCPRPGARFHGDVDLLLLPGQVDRAEHIAIQMGWRSARAPVWILNQNHNALSLERGGVRIDVHCQVLHVVLPWYRAQRRITAMVWKQSRVRPWGGFDIREPSPVDMLLVGLVLQRCWGAEAWQLKPHDVIDFKNISGRLGVTRQALSERARQLRCERTLVAFLDRCDPELGRLDLSPIPPSQRRRLNRVAFTERGLLGPMESTVARAMRAPFAALLALRFAPVVLKVRKSLAREADMRSLLDELSDTVATRASTLPRALVVAGVRWAHWLVGSGAFGVCLVRALATFVALRERGWPVDFV